MEPNIFTLKPFGPAYPGSPSIVAVKRFVAIKETHKGTYTGHIQLINLAEDPVAFKILTTNCFVFKFEPSDAGIIPVSSIASINFETKPGLDINFGDIKKHLFLLQSTPVYVAPYMEIQLDPNGNDYFSQLELNEFWKVIPLNDTRTEKSLLVPVPTKTKMLFQPSAHDMKVQQNLKNFFVQTKYFIRTLWRPYELNHKIFTGNFPQEYEELVNRIAENQEEDAPEKTFLYRYQDYVSDKKRFVLLLNDKKRGLIYCTVGLLTTFVTLGSAIYMGYDWEKKHLDKHLANENMFVRFFSSILGFMS